MLMIETFTTHQTMNFLEITTMPTIIILGDTTTMAWETIWRKLVGITKDESKFRFWFRGFSVSVTRRKFWGFPKLAWQSDFFFGF